MNGPREPAPDYPLRDGELARRDAAGRVAVRPSPLRVRIPAGDLITADDHRLDVAFSCAVAARPEPAERQMLDEALLSDRPSASAADVATLFSPRLRHAAAPVVAGRTAADWLDEAGRAALADVLRQAADAAAFAAGLDVLPPYQVELDSPSLRQLERDRTARDLAERQQEDRLSHLRRAAEVMREFEALRTATPGLTVSAVVGRMAPADQPRVVQMLLEAETAGHSTQTLFAVAGTSLVRITPTDAIEEIDVPTTAGPLRSVQGISVDGDARLALGARLGAMIVDLSHPTAAELYLAPDITSPLGFNRVVAWNGRIWASHSEAGLVAWDPGRYDAPTLRIGPDRTLGPPRCLLTAGEQLLLFAAGTNVCAMNDTLDIRTVGDAGATDAVVALLPGPDGPIVVRESGEIQVLDDTTLQILRRDRRSGRVTAATLLPFYDSPRILLAGEHLPLTCISLLDPAILQYPTPHRGLRTLTATADQITAISADRQRLIFLPPNATTPARDLHLGARLRHRIADLTYAHAQ